MDLDVYLSDYWLLWSYPSCEEREECCWRLFDMLWCFKCRNHYQAIRIAVASVSMYWLRKYGAPLCKDRCKLVLLFEVLFHCALICHVHELFCLIHCNNCRSQANLYVMQDKGGHGVVWWEKVKGKNHQTSDCCLPYALLSLEKTVNWMN